MPLTPSVGNIFGTAVSRLIVAVIAAILVMTVAALPARAGLFNPESFELANGMQVVVISDHRAPVVTHMVWYRVGSADEPTGKSGVAHFLEHLLFKGTEKFPAGIFRGLVAKHGGQENAFTSTDYTAYFQTVAVDRLEMMMELEADRMTGLTLIESEVLAERDVILEERRSRVDNNPSSLLSEQMRAVQYIQYPYRLPVIGWEHEIRALTFQDAIDFYKIYYAPNNATLIVAGDVTVDQVRPLAEKYYGVLEARELPPRIRPQEPPHLTARRMDMQHPRVREPSWRRSYMAPSYLWGDSRHAMPLGVLAEIVGGGTTSRLYRALVAGKKIAAQANSFYSAGNLGPSQFFVVGVPANGGDIGELETEILAVLKDVEANGVTEEEFARAKRSMLASAVYARDNVQGAARTFGAALSIGRSIEDVESWPDRMRALTIEQVNEAAAMIFDETQSVTAILRPPGD